MHLVNHKTKQEPKRVVLALFPNALGLGYALFESQQELIYQQTMRIRPMSNTKSKQIILKLLDSFKPDVVILENTTCKSSRKRERIIKLIEYITEECKTQNIKIHHYSRKQIREVFSVFNAFTKQEIAKHIITMYPKLKPKLPKPWSLGNAESHNQGLFDAVSLGVTHYYVN